MRSVCILFGEDVLRVIMPSRYVGRDLVVQNVSNIRITASVSRSTVPYLHNNAYECAYAQPHHAVA